MRLQTIGVLILRVALLITLFCHYLVITLSVPDTASVAEESGSVQVCATLSDIPAGGTIAIIIMLTTSDGMIVVLSE